MMNFLQAIESSFSNYVNFSGRAIRSEFWFWMLFLIVGGIAAWILDFMLIPDWVTVSPFTTLFDFGTFVPGIAVSIRRLHDVDRSGWWILLIGVPVAGFIGLTIWWCTKGTSGYNGFGPDYFRPGGYARARPAISSPRRA